MSHLITNEILDIMAYDPTLKIVRFPYEGNLYDATVAMAGVEPIPRPDMYSGIWIHGEKVEPVKLNDDYSLTKFRRTVSVVILFPKALSVSASANGGQMANIGGDGKVKFDQKDDYTYFSGIYDDEGNCYGLMIDQYGNLLLKGKGGTVTIGQKNINIESRELSIEANEKWHLPFKKFEFGFIPQTVLTPYPTDFPDLDYIDKVKTKITAALSLLGKDSII